MHETSGSDSGRRAFLGTAVAFGITMPLAGSSLIVVPDVSLDMAKAARSWIRSLSPPQQGRAQLAWSSSERYDWHYVPRQRPGVALRDMDERQVVAAWNVLGSLLSARGLEQVRGVILLERILGELTASPGYRDPGNYALVIFGDPAGVAPWAWRFEGHHLSIHVVVAPGHGVAVTPVFYGANPADVPERHAHAGFRLVGAEEDDAFALIRSLEGSERKDAILSDRSLGDIVSGPGRESSLQRYEGVALARLSGVQCDGVMRILGLYAGTMREEIANAAIAKIREAGVATLHFAWAGSPTRGRAHYFRIHGPTVLVEYDNTQSGANHVHSVWLETKNVFGHDLLKAHYQGGHGGGHGGGHEGGHEHPHDE